MKAILDSRMWIRLDLNPAVVANTEFQRDNGNRAYLGAQLLLYDKIIIQTKDFGIVPIMANWFGIEGLKNLLKSDSLAFVWHELLLFQSPDEHPP